MLANGHVDTARLVELLRDDATVSDAAVLPGPEPAEFTVLIVPQGIQPGHALRELVMRLAGPGGERAQVVLTLAIPRDVSGRLDLEEAAAAASQPGMVFRFDPPTTGAERCLADLVREVLADVRLVSVTDSLAALGCDSVSAVEIVVGIRDRFGVDIDPHQVFGAGSLRELAALLADQPALAAPR